MTNKKNNFWRNLFKLIFPYWLSKEKWHALGLLLLIVICSVIEVRTNVAMNRWQRDFYDALQVFNKSALFSDLIRYSFLLVATLLSFGYIIYFNGLLANRWRRWMTENYLAKWLNGNHIAYAMQLFNKKLDNPDQRISEDLNDFSLQTLSIASGLFSTILSFISFSIILWHLSGPFIFTISRYQLTIPGYMVWAALFYAVIGTWVTTLIGRKLTKLNYEQQQYNANFRFNLIRTREAVEQISLYKGEEAEQKHLNRTFHAVFSNYLKIITIEKYLSFFRNGYGTATFILGLFIALPIYFSQKLQVGNLMQINSAFLAIVMSLSYIINTYTQLANWRSVIQRLAEFTKIINETTQNIKHTNLTIINSEAQELIIDNLDLLLPNDEILLKQFRAVIEPGEKILMTGDVGIGKSTLLRTIAGIWPFARGKIILPHTNKTLLLPQKSYLPQGTLRDLLAYPQFSNDFADDQCLNALAQCGLEKLTSKLHVIKNWSQELSLGEQQLVILARIFLQQPNLLFLDEATSSLDENTERKIYQKIFKLLPQATIISVAHRSSLRQFHTREINLNKINSSLESKVGNAFSELVTKNLEPIV